MAPLVGKQYPNVRAGTYCVACHQGDKDVGLLVHWRCHDALKRRHDGGYGSRVEAELEQYEAGQRRWPDEEDAAGNEEGA